MNPALSNSVECSTLVELLRLRATQTPDQCAYIFLGNGEQEQSRLTYKELDHQARVIAARLQQIQAPGERVLLLYPQSLDYLTAFFGCLYAGAIAVPAYPPSPVQLARTIPRIEAYLNDARPSVVLTTSAVFPQVEELSRRAQHGAAFTNIATENLPADLSAAWSEPDVTGDTLAFLQYSSGSTSTPKGVMVRHSNLLANHRMMQQAWQLPKDRPFVSWLPLFHDLGLIGMALHSIYEHVPCVLMSPMSFLQKPFRWLKAVSSYGAAFSGGPNFAYDLCARKVTPAQMATIDLSCWELALNGAEPIRSESLQHFVTTFAQCGFRPEAMYPGYGLAEATLFVTGGDKHSPARIQTLDAAALEHNQARVIAPDAAGGRSVVQCGHTWGDQKVIIVNPTTLTACAPDEVGEIWISGPNVTQGYWQKPDATAQTFHAYLADTNEGPFLRTGDLGVFYQGEIIITGRAKDVIIIDGANHYPQDIEYTVEQSHPAIRPGGCAAFSIEVDGLEQLHILAEIERNYQPYSTDGSDALLEDGLTPQAEPIIKAIRHAVVEQHELQAATIMLLKAGGVLKTSSGKLQRQACRNAFLEGRLPKWEPNKLVAETK